MDRTWSAVTIDCGNPERLGRFWGALLHRDARPEQDRRVRLRDDQGVLPDLVLREVPEPQRGRTGVHLDLTVESVEAGIATVVALGGAATGKRHEHDDRVVVVMTDPEGNEFCLVARSG